MYTGVKYVYSLIKNILIQQNLIGITFSILESVLVRDEWKMWKERKHINIYNFIFPSPSAYKKSKHEHIN